MKRLDLEMNGRRVKVHVEKVGPTLWLHYDGKTLSYQPPSKIRRTSESAEGQGELVAPIPGKIIKVKASEGDEVNVGQTLIVLEAMKMEYNISSEVKGQVLSLNCVEGEQVQQGQCLVSVGEQSE